MTNDKEIANIFKALGHPARITILKYLASLDSCMAGNIVDVLPLAQSTVSQHLNELKKVGIIKGETQGVRTKYCIDQEKFEVIKEMIGDFTESLSDKRDSCC